MSSSSLSADRLDFQRGTESEPLSERDIQLIHRYLSDPTVFPREFKRWVTEHSSDTVDIAKTQVHGLVNAAGSVVIGNASMAILGAALTGVVIPYAAVVAPEGWLLCDGSEVSRLDYANLFALLGTSWGIPADGAKFKLPDLRGRTPFGVDANVGFAQNEGYPAGARGPKHNHFFVDTKGFSASGGTSGGGSHAHTYRRHTESTTGVNQGTAGPMANPNAPGGFDASTTDNGDHSHGVSVSGSVTISGTTSGGGPQDQPGWVGLPWIIGSGKLP